MTFWVFTAWGRREVDRESAVKAGFGKEVVHPAEDRTSVLVVTENNQV